MSPRSEPDGAVSMYADEPEAFEDKLAHLSPKTEPYWKRFWDAVLHCCWWCCCCFWFASDPYKRDSNTWAVTSANDHVARPAHLKISTSDKRAVEIKIVYAVNPAVASQLYEVDVFMFFLQDLEAVSNNFYHDLWQVVRLHTPKVTLSAIANDPSAGFIGLIEEELLAIQSKQAAGDAAAVQQEMDKVVQQLRLHVCIYRNSVRRALKGIAHALEDLDGSQAGAAETGQVCQAVITVVTQIAQSLHQLQLACTPCQSPEAPETIRAVWRLVDEYALAESERATLKLLKGLDKHLQLVQQSAPAPATSTAAVATAPAPSSTAAVSTAAATAPITAPASVPGPAATAVTEANQQGTPWSAVPQQAYWTASAPLAYTGQATVITGEAAHSMPSDAPRQPPVETDAASEALQHHLQAQHGESGMEGHAAWQLSGGTVQTSGALDAATLPVSGLPQTDPNQRGQQYWQERRLPHRRAVTLDQPQGFGQQPSARGLVGPSLVSDSGSSRREKLEYRLSQDDVGAPSLAELSKLRQQAGLGGRWSVDMHSRCRLHPRTGFLPNPGQTLNGQQHEVQLLHGGTAHPVAGPTLGGLSQQGHMQANQFVNPLVQRDHCARQLSQQHGQTLGLLQEPQRQLQYSEGQQPPVYLQDSGGQPGPMQHAPVQLQQPVQDPLHQPDQGQYQQPPQGQWQLPEQEQLQHPYEGSEPSSRMLSLMQNADAVQTEAEGFAEDSKRLEAGGDQLQTKLQALRAARQLVVDAVVQLQEERRQQGYLESILVPNDPGRNEAYTNCIKCLKHNARAAVVLKPQLLPQSFLLADLVGMTVAGLAMLVACAAIYVATRFSRNQLSGVYVTVIVVGYMLKDRLKEWGKRYLQPSAMKFGFEFPDRTVKMRDSRGKRVGRCKEWVKVVGDTEIDGRVLAMRHKDKGHIPPERHATKPERVLAYRKKMEVSWQQLDPRLRGVDGLDDIMRFDLQHFCRRMQPPDEPHYCLERGADGSVQVQKVQCARVYHINIVLRIRTSLQDVRKDKAYREKSLQIQRARIIMDQTGIQRLEATDDSVHLMGERHSASPAFGWKPDMHLPRMSLPHIPAFGRHSALPRPAELKKG